MVSPIALVSFASNSEKTDVMTRSEEWAGGDEEEEEEEEEQKFSKKYLRGPNQ